MDGCITEYYAARRLRYFVVVFYRVLSTFLNFEFRIIFVVSNMERGYFAVVISKV